MTNEEPRRKLGRLCMPYAMKRLDDLRERGTRFAHYTSAYAALQIIERNCVWMRNSVVMSDFSEVEHGQRCLSESWHDEDLGGRLCNLLDRLKPGAAAEFEEAYDGLQFHREVQSYLVSMSEHGNGAPDEDKFGRLSMWRAYGGNTNVAFVFNNRPFISESYALSAFTSPVLYCDEDQFKSHFAAVVQGLDENFAFLQQVGTQEVIQALVWAFHFAALSTKHPGFAEEREWRVIHSPSLMPTDRIRFDVESVDGVPQRVYKLNLVNYPDEGFVGATLPELLEEIIIGPTQFPWPIYEALATQLENAGVDDAWNKVRISDIPLRR